MTQSTEPANRQQAQLWNEGSGRTWVDLQPLLDRALAPIERRLVDTAFPGEGAAVLDIGCGAGATTFAMARRLGPAGRCVGADISATLLAAARRRAEAEGLANAGFVEADAQTASFEGVPFDAVISRFGVMFFDDPAAAFANIRAAARPGATLTFFAWRSPAENSFMTLAMRVAEPLLPPRPPQDPTAPGPFALADAERLSRILDEAGWSAVNVAAADIPCELPRADMATYVTRLGPVGAALREVDAATAEQVRAVVVPAYERFLDGEVARFTAACWLVTARA